MAAFSLPSEENAYLSDHVARLRESHRHWTGRDFLDPRMSHADAARFLYAAPFAVVSHDTARDPIFNYANQTALSLFGMDWEQFTTLPSRRSAERAVQEERERILQEVTEKGFLDDYQGIRIGRHGRRFRIEAATLWNLLDERGKAYGQAACIRHWTFL